LTPALSSGLVAIVSIITSELETFFRDEDCQSGEGVQRGVPLRGGAVVWRYAIAFVCGKIGMKSLA
jgi:hypothetical protein